MQLSLWKKHGQEIEWGKTLVSAIGLAIVALALGLLTSEARDFFEQKIFVVQRMIADGWTRDLEGQLQNLRNMQQLSLSGVWLFSSIVLMVIGLWKRRRNFRLVAIGLFAVTILNIFIYDLSFLETLYRIFSFMGLGVILFGVSYLYQKYKGIILDTENQPEGSGLTNQAESSHSQA